MLPVSSSQRSSRRASCRTAVLQRYEILDTPPEDCFDRIADLATDIFDAPTALVTFVDDEREWIKARRQFVCKELPLGVSFGTIPVESGQPLAVEDAASDSRFAKNPLVTDPPGIRFYAGVPLRTNDDVCIGTVAVMDTVPRSPARAALQQLETLASLVVKMLEDRNRPSPPGDERLIDALLSSASASAVVLDEEGIILKANQNWRSFAHKHELDDLASAGKGVNYLDALTPSAPPDENQAGRARDGLERVLRGEQDTFDLVYPRHCPEGKRWCEMQVWRLDHPRARAIVSHCDLPDRQSKDCQHRILETAVEHAREAVVITESGSPNELDPPITYVNPAFTEMTGYRPDEVIGKPPSILQGPDTESWVMRELREHMRREESFEGETVNYCKDGTPFINHWSIAPVRDEKGDVTHWISLQRDVTEERHMEKRLLKAQERERQRIAEEMHHEMGGLLTSLQMAVDHAQPSGKEGASSRQSGLERIERVANELSDIVRTLTERLHSRIIDDYGLSHALSRMATDFQERYGLSVEVNNEIPDETHLPALVEKISYRGIYEALKNIVDHAQTDYAQLFLNVEDRTLRIDVIDEGIGFDPSQELDRDQYGLVAIKKRADRMNGHLEINSTPEDGTRVTIKLPLSTIPPRSRG